MPRLLLIRGGAVGDFIVTLPVLAAMRQTFPQAWIEVLGHPHRAGLALHPRYANRVTDLEQWDLYRLFTAQAMASESLVTYLRRFTMILSYLPVPDHSFATQLRRYCTGHVLTGTPHPRARVHITEHLWQPVSRVLRRPASLCPHVYLNPESEAQAAQFWQAAGLPDTGVLAVHPGSGGRHKLWPLPGWQRLLAWAAQQGLACLLVYGPAEQRDQTNLLAQQSLPSWPQATSLPLPLLAALLARCQAFVGHDSGITHLAAAVGIPTLALFGPTDPLVWGPRSPRACVLQPAAPEPLTLQNLPPALVIDVLAQLIEGKFTFAPSRVDCTILRYPG